MAQEAPRKCHREGTSLIEAGETVARMGGGNSYCTENWWPTNGQLRISNRPSLALGRQGATALVLSVGILAESQSLCSPSH